MENSGGLRGESRSMQALSHAHASACVAFACTCKHMACGLFCMSCKQSHKTPHEYPKNSAPSGSYFKTQRVVAQKKKCTMSLSLAPLCQ
jgi:hypothetical protein